MGRGFFFLTNKFMSKYGDEQVLVIPTEEVMDFLSSIDEGDLKDGTGFIPLDYEYLLDDILYHATFIPREEAEVNSEYKQPIVYVLISYGPEILHYSRLKSSSTEDRLHGLRSCGVGGHINPEDINDEWVKERNRSDTFMNALYREIEEEIGIKEEAFDSVQFLGLVNEESTDVGRHHIGLVYRVDLPKKKLGLIEKNLEDPRWATGHEILLLPNLEGWSKLILKKEG